MKRENTMKTMTALFDDYEDAAQAVRALEAAGFEGDDVSLVVSTYGTEGADADIVSGEDAATESAGTGAGLGALLGGASGLLAGLGVIAIPGVGPVVAAGWLLSTAVGAVAGAAVGGATGGLIGTLVHSGVHESDAHVLAESMRRGGSVVSVRTDEARVEEVEGIFEAAHRVDIAQRRYLLESEGWTAFDPSAPDYDPEEARRQRDRDNLSGPF